jgi:hypothetical protein
VLRAAHITIQPVSSQTYPYGLSSGRSRASWNVAMSSSARTTPGTRLDEKRKTRVPMR